MRRAESRSPRSWWARRSGSRSRSTAQARRPCRLLLRRRLCGSTPKRAPQRRAPMRTPAPRTHAGASDGIRAREGANQRALRSLLEGLGCVSDRLGCFGELLANELFARRLARTALVDELPGV